MGRYEELFWRVSDLEGKLSVLKAQMTGNEEASLIEQVQALERELLSVKEEVAAMRNAESHYTPVEMPVYEPADSVFRVRNMQTEPARIYSRLGDALAEQERPRRRDMEFQVGKTVMSVLASLLILVSLGLFGSLVYPMLGDGAKVIMLYAVSAAFTGIGLWGMKGKYKVFFTAFAGCGISAFYVSSVISSFVYGIFGELFLMVLIYLWILGVAYLSRARVHTFSYVCYVGILVSTALCWVQYMDLPIALGCYVLGIVTLYLFTRTGEYRKDAFYFIQFPVVLLVLILGYQSEIGVILWIMLLCSVSYVIQKYLYEERTQLYKLCFFMVEVVCGIGYLAVNDRATSMEFVNVFYILLTGLVSIWSFCSFEERFYKIAPLCFMSAVVPILNYGTFFEEYISYAPFAMAIIAVAYLLQIDMMKGIAYGYMLIYTVRSVLVDDSFLFLLVLIVSLVEFGLLFGIFAFDRHLDRAMFAVLACSTLTSICGVGTIPLTLLGYIIAVVMCVFYNSSFFVVDDFSQRLGWTWNGFWMCFGSGIIMDTPTDSGLLLVFMFLLVLVAFMVNVKWQLECDHWLAGLEFCIKSSWFLFMILLKLGGTGVAMSVAFLLLAVWCVVLGSMVRRKIIRLYGLVLTLLSVFKCLVFDISYSSSLARPFGLLVAGLLCFGVSWIYSALERKLREDSEE